MTAHQQRTFPDANKSACGLPSNYTPVAPDHFRPERIYLSKGSVSSPERQAFVAGICDCFPDADIVQCLDTPHNRIDLAEPDALRRHQRGKQTLVFGQIGRAVRFSSEQGNTCPNYWHFSTYGFCPYGCKYCYLAGTPGVWFSPTVKIYVNLPEILRQVDRTARRAGAETAFYLGKLQDPLALDALTGYSTVTMPLFAGHPYARQILLTKSAGVSNLRDIDHRGRTILSWSVNPPEVARVWEANAPAVSHRIAAMRHCVEWGYPVRAVLMPVIPVDSWRDVYAGFLRYLLAMVPIRRLTIGGICSYGHARGLMSRKLGDSNDVARHLESRPAGADGRMRYRPEVRLAMYDHILQLARELRPDLELALCLEEPSLHRELARSHPLGPCNCLL